jgi:hypothetical protein
MKGDGLADRGLGIGGGGISIIKLSLRASGDTELLCSESVVPAVDEDEVGKAGNGSCCCSCSAASTNSLRTCSLRTGVVVCFRRCGFVIGDCRTPGLALFVAFFLGFFTLSAEFVIGPDPTEVPPSILTGELVVTVPCLCSKEAMLSFWACNAGEVSGLK